MVTEFLPDAKESVGVAPSAEASLSRNSLIRARDAYRSHGDARTGEPGPRS